MPILSVFLILPAVALAGGYAAPTAGDSPHGNYSDTSTKCKVCHAIHNASADTTLGASPEALLRSGKGVPDGAPRKSPEAGDACVYCHITGSWAIKKVYNGVLANYTTDSRKNHDDVHRFQMIDVNYAGCISCHSVHGSDCLAGYTSDIVRADPNAGNAMSVSTLTDFCRDCHEDPYSAPWGGLYGFRCSFCHNEGPGGFVRGGNDDDPDPDVLTDQLAPFYTQARDGVTHVMTATLTGIHETQVAWADSTDCRDCHAGGAATASNSFPHYTSGAQFLDDDYSTPDTGMDRVCLNCHVEGGDGSSYTTGVGKTF